MQIQEKRKRWSTAVDVLIKARNALLGYIYLHREGYWIEGGAIKHGRSPTKKWHHRGNINVYRLMPNGGGCLPGTPDDSEPLRCSSHLPYVALLTGLCNISNSVLIAL